MLASGSNVGLADMPVTVRSEAEVSGSPTVKAIGGVAMSMRVLVGGRVEMMGARLAGRTVTENVVLLDFAPVSVTQSVIVEEPDCEPAVTFTVRLAALPLIAMFAGEMTLGLEEMALTASDVAGASASSTVKESGPVDWVTRMV